jgi:hypothetical protein
MSGGSSKGSSLCDCLGGAAAEAAAADGEAAKEVADRRLNVSRGLAEVGGGR